MEMMMRNLLTTFFAMMLTTGILWGQPRAQESAGKPASQRSAARPSLLKPSSLNEQAPTTFKAKFTTTKGDFVVEVTRAWAPLGADRFYNLVKNHFYDSAAFFRVLPGFVAQFGLSAKPEISRVWASATFKDDPVTQSNLAGYLTFATAGPNTRTTQLFINLADNQNLDGMGFAPFGKVIEGMDVVQKFYSGYGEGAPSGRGPDQSRITNEGKAYLDKSFPLLDSIKTAVIVQ
jgi:peptidyl-prolyl cis-trans isomerase A (cyclophilin A)